ncbi:hypothetical protein [Paucibacter soli]|uniref:hypothetical protein n=1 Tax=Paucibacter soli TaxID=3133433 RepID=UPI0030A1D23D
MHRLRHLELKIGYINIGYRADGFPAAFDKTRAECNWSVDDFPPDNGWGKAYPDVAPTRAKEATYDPVAKEQFSLKAWIDTNAAGKSQLLVRINENPAICKGSFLVDPDRFYVEQGGKTVSVIPGFDFGYSCTKKPITLALQGDFNPDAPFTLKVAPFHFHTTDTITFISTVSLP